MQLRVRDKKLVCLSLVDEGAGERGVREMDVGATLAVDSETAEVGECAIHDPGNAAGPLAALDAAPSDPWRDAARLASEPCNKTEMRRQLMDAASALDRAGFGERRLMDLTDGRKVGAGSAHSCLFVADGSSEPPGLLTITLRKNSFGDDLIEVRPF